MGKKIFEVYLAKEDVPNNEAYAKLDLPASPWELWDAMEKVRLNEGEQLYMEIEDYEAFGYLAPYLDGLDISLIELNDLAALLSPLDEVQEAAFEGLFSMEVQRKVNANGGVITLQDLRDLAVSARTDCYAFITIAAELGVRSKDICNLKLSDIDWELCSISFVQSKTGKPNTLPLSEKVGSAIIDYLHIRPQTKCEYLFVSLNPPYGKMKSIHSAFHRYVARSGVKVPIHAHHGLHSLRATVATKLLSADVSPDIIFSFLGHSDRESLGHYIRLDIENLRECALSFEDGDLL